MFGRKSLLREKTEKEKMEEKKGGGRGDKKPDAKDSSTLTGPEVGVVVVHVRVCAHY